MGSAFGRLLTFFHRNAEVRILIIGLDAAGKTTMLYRLALNEVVTTIPTIGFNVETIKHAGVNFTCWDVSGRSGIRALWRHYYENTQALVLVVDSNDRERIGEVKGHLMSVCGEDELKDAIILVIANKQDLPNAMSVDEVTEKLGMKSVRHTWNVVPANAKEGVGLHEGLDWLASQIAHAQTKKTIVKSVDIAGRDLEATKGFLSSISSWFCRFGKGQSLVEKQKGMSEMPKPLQE